MGAGRASLIFPRPFPGLGRDVSLLGLGAGPLGEENVSESEAERLLQGALDLGINLIDTAPSYGRSEERIGRYLAKRRADFILTTKCGYGVPGVEDWTPESIRRGIDAALVRLRTDHLDAVFLHSCPLETLDRPGVIGALEASVASGKVGLAGYSGENAALEFAMRSGRFGVVQRSVNLCDQGLASAVPFGGAVLAKRSLANAAWDFARRPEREDVAQYWERLRAMEIDPRGLGGAELSLRFTAFMPGVTCSLVGTRSLARLGELRDFVARGPLPEDLVGELRAAYQRHGRHWPGLI